MHIGLFSRFDDVSLWCWFFGIIGRSGVCLNVVQEMPKYKHSRRNLRVLFLSADKEMCNADIARLKIDRGEFYVMP